MKISNLFRFVLCGLALFSAVNLWAQDKGQGRGGRGIEGAVRQLDLSGEQKDELKAIFAESRDSRQAILAKHGVEMGSGTRPDREQMKMARPEMAALRKETESKVKALLSEEQLAKLQELRAKEGQGAGMKKKKAAAEE